jgi:hypothetical protein
MPKPDIPADPMKKAGSELFVDDPSLIHSAAHIMNELSNGTANGHGAKPYVKPSTRLRRLLAQDGCVQAPGVYDGISARLAIEAGFQVMVSCRSPYF